MLIKTSIFTSFCLVAIILSSPSCTKGVTDDAGDGSITISSITAFYPALEWDESTKSEAGEVQYKMYWSVGDRMAVINVSQGNRIDTYTSTARVSNTGSGEGTFSPDADYSYDPSDLLYAVYPASAITSVDNSGDVFKAKVHLTDNLSYTSKSDSPMFAQNDIQVSPVVQASSLVSSGSSYPGLPMKRMTGMIRILSHISDQNLNTEPVNTITVNAVGIAGTADIVFSGKTVGSTPSINVNQGDAQTMTVTLTNKPLVASAAAIAEFIPVFPIWLGKDSERPGFNVIYSTDNYVVGFHREWAVNLRSNNVLAMNIFEGAYTRVRKQENASGDFKWWYAPKEHAGNYVGDGASMGGNDAGQFTE